MSKFEWGLIDIFAVLTLAVFSGGISEKDGSESENELPPFSRFDEEFLVEDGSDTLFDRVMKHIKKTLNRFDGDKYLASKSLGITFKGLNNKLHS